MMHAVKNSQQFISVDNLITSLELDNKSLYFKEIEKECLEFSTLNKRRKINHFNNFIIGTNICIYSIGYTASKNII